MECMETFLKAYYEDEKDEDKKLKEKLSQWKKNTYIVYDLERKTFKVKGTFKR